MPVDSVQAVRPPETPPKSPGFMQNAGVKQSHRKRSSTREPTTPRSPSENSDQMPAESDAEYGLDRPHLNGKADRHRAKDERRRIDYKALPKLMRDSRKNRISSVQTQLDGGVDVNERSQGTTALHLAASHGHTELAEVLISRGAELDTNDDEGYSPLIYAVWAGHDSFVKMMLARGALLSVPGSKHGNTALHVAAKRNKPEMLKLLLASAEGAGLVDALNKDHWTPLHFAADKRNIACAEVLLEAGANPNMADRRGTCPLHLAANCPLAALTALLVRKGGNVNAVNSDGCTPLHLATQNGHDEVVYVLCSNGADVSIRYQYGNELSKKRKPSPDSEVPVIFQQATRFGFLGKDALSGSADDDPKDEGAAEELPSAAELSKRKLEFKRADKWSYMFRKWREKQQKRLKQMRPPPRQPEKLRSRVYKGLPDRLRFDAWLAIAEVAAMRAEKKDPLTGRPLDFQVLCLKSTPHTSQIDLDVNRSARNHIMFVERYGPGQVRLFNILKAYAVYDPEVGYCQGMADLTALMLMYISDEDAFFMLIRLMQDPRYNLADKMKPGLAGLTHTFDIFDQLLLRHLPRLAAHLDKENIMSAAYATKWFMLAFLDIFCFQLTLRLFDMFLLDGYDLVYSVAISLFTIYEARLLETKFEGLMKFLHSLDKLTDLDPDEFIRHIARHRITPKEIRRAEQAVEQQRQEAKSKRKR
eukprot:TRINITY_DN11155_c0_g1_i1.p1 TRINITY_DN11155_c0_g1~~TRINITY_DN11155_c0_g1_i1.p1  ORF type:complete len:702 (+),score=224.31 TRINITY_DN11155_c0_g1_i1:155-2260(+)